MKIKLGFSSKRAFDPYYQKRKDAIKEMMERANLRGEKVEEVGMKLLEIPDLEHLLDGKRAVLKTPYKFRMETGEIITVPVGFITDGASIPKFVWSITGGPWGEYLYAAIPHDYLYYTKKMTRKGADKVFLKIMVYLGVSEWKYRIMHRAVRDWGWIPWNKKGGNDNGCTNSSS